MTSAASMTSADRRAALPPPRLSVVIPAHDEAPNIEPCYRELVAVLEALGSPFEVVVVDDGSRDETFARLAVLAEADPRLRAIRFRQWAGKTAALDAGFRAARGEFVVTMDADLQNDPRDIPLLLPLLDAHDAVCGWRVNRQDTWARRVGSRLANAVRRRVTGDRVHDTGCALKAFRREVVGRLRLYEGMHRFLPALLAMEGCRVAEIPVRHRPRLAGRTKYGNWQRLWVGLADLWAVRWMARRRLRYEVEAEIGAPRAQ